MSIILADFTEPTENRKERLVAVKKEAVYKDIDLLTHKHVDGSDIPSPRISNARSSDTEEDVDGAVLARYVEFRDAQLRARIQFALSDKWQEEASSRITQEQECYVYHLSVAESFNDNALRPLAEYIHRFLVWGALYDWYAQFDQRQASVYGSQIENLEDEITGLLQTPSIVKRPMQPFGPARRIF